jgi:heavy metal sensor kinase
MQMLHRRTIRARLTLWYVLLLGLSLLVFSVVLYVILDNTLDRQVDNSLRVAADQALSAVATNRGQISVPGDESESDLRTLGERGMLVRVVDSTGRTVASEGPFRTVAIPESAVGSAQQRQAAFFTLDGADGDMPVRLYTVPYTENGTIYGVVAVGESLRTMQETLRQLLLVLAVVVPGTIGLASLGGLWLAHRALAPIDGITRRVQRLNAADLDQRLNLDLPDDEVGRLARTFDNMLARLDEAFHRQRQFTADAAHELRTPLAIMKGDIEVTLLRPRRGPEYRRALAGLAEEVDGLTRLVEDLLLLARSDTGQPLLHLEPVDLVDLLAVVADQMRLLAEPRGLSVTLECPEILPITGDPDKLLRLFRNLMDNAITYTPPGGRITLRARAEPAGRVLVEVADTGPGISAEHQPHIFERFYRADASRSRASGGAGLGLAIARWIAEAHGGQIAVESALGWGTTFRVSLPRAAP